MIATRERVIDGVRFKVTQLTGSDGVRMAAELQAILLPALGGLADGAEGMAAIAEGKVNLSKALLHVSSCVTPEKLEQLYRSLFYNTWVIVEGREVELLPVFETFFQGRIDLFFKAFAFALEVNFQSFFAAAAAAAGKFKTAFQSKVSAISTGASGGSSQANAA